MKSKKFTIYTDGSCLGNPGPGGWGVVILDQNEVEITTLSGQAEDTTNNRMEMTAIIKALEWIHRKSGIEKESLHSIKIDIHSDSNLIIQTLNKGWKKKANTDLWSEIDKLRAWLDISWNWVKAHHTNQYNNHADELAFNAAQKAKASI